MERLEHIKQLYRQYLAKAISDVDKRQLMNFFATGTDAELQEVIGPLLPAEVEDLKDVSAYDDRAERILERVRHWTTTEELAAPRSKRLWLPYAAAILMATLAGAWIFFGDQINLKPNIATIPSEDIAPGGNRATLTLADGRTIDLSEAQIGIIVGTEDITYTDGSALDVISSDLALGERRDISLLELSTPKAGQYQVTLPDGSKVWLNAASTLKYPSRFSGDERIVELIGEGYFEVNRRKSNQSESSAFQPFKVITNGQAVEVLGTKFNISAYADEPETKTTLVEGSVKVSNPASQISKLLKPGQQATTRDAATEIQEVDVNDFIAWKNGYIVITNATLADVITQVERWYDVDFDVKSQSDVTAYVSLNRAANLSEVLEAIELNYGIKFRIAGRRVTEQD